MLTVAVLGNGFVGNATRYYLEKYCPNVTEVLVEDPGQDKYITDMEWAHPAYAFVCVPTNLDGDKLSLEYVYQALDRLQDVAPLAIPVIRSTLGPDLVDLILEKYAKSEKQFIIWPEFLREDHWETDVNDKTIPTVLGGESETFMNLILPHDEKVIYQCGLHEACIMKMSRNAMLAAKVAQANMLWQLCKRYGSSYTMVTAFLKHDGSLGDSHWNVPGPDGRFGFGGKCLPKDTTHYNSLYVKNEKGDGLYDKVLEFKHDYYETI